MTAQGVQAVAPIVAFTLGAVKMLEPLFVAPSARGAGLLVAEAGRDGAARRVPAAARAGAARAGLTAARTGQYSRAGAPLAAVAGAAAGLVASARPRRGVRQSRLVLAAGKEAPALISKLDIDYAALRDTLEAKDFKAADAETRRLLIVAAGDAAVKRGWVYFSEVKRIPEEDMTTIDGLWSHYSKGKFGFVAQRKVWKQCRAQFDKFAEEVSWFTDKWQNRNWPDEFIYDLTAPAGHLPLTNCIRGAQVLSEIMDHPAYQKKKATQKTAKRSGLSLL